MPGAQGVAQRGAQGVAASWRRGGAHLFDGDADGTLAGCQLPNAADVYDLQIFAACMMCRESRVRVILTPHSFVYWCARYCNTSTDAYSRLGSRAMSRHGRLF